MASSSFKLETIIIAAVVICVSVALGFVCIYHSILLYRVRSVQFIKVRNPKLIILLCAVCIIPLLLVAIPCKTMLSVWHMHDDTLVHNDIFFFFWWLVTFLKELLICYMFIVIVFRCWLLYYQHCYGISIIDKNWKGLINAREADNDFWIKHRKTLGDAASLTMFGILVINVLLVIFLVVSIHEFRTRTLTVLDALSLSAAIPCCMFIGGLLLDGHRKKVFVADRDKFQIIVELRYLMLAMSVFVLLEIAHLVQVDLGDGDALMLPTLILALKTVCVFCTGFIQNRLMVWRLTRSFQKELESSQSALTFSRSNSRSSEHDSQSQRPSKLLKMADVIRHPRGFPMFMRYCLHELSVEGLLFLVEVSQYKAALTSDNTDDSKRNLQRASLALHSTPRSLFSVLLQSSEKRAIASAPPLTEPLTAAASDANNPQALRTHSQSLIVRQHPLAQLEEAILSHDWLPISRQLYAAHAGTAMKNPNEMPRLLEVSIVEPRLQMAAVKSRSRLHTDSAVPGDLHAAEQKEEARASHDHATDAHDVGWMYEKAKYVFQKYVDAESDIAINISWTVRHDLCELFEQKEMQTALLSILERNQVNVDCELELVQQNKRYRRIIQRYLLHVFDQATAEIWSLLETDVFMRFMHTTQYKHLWKHHIRKHTY